MLVETGGLSGPGASADPAWQQDLSASGPYVRGGAPGSKPRGAGSEIGASGTKLGTIGSRIGALGSEIGAPGSE